MNAADQAAILAVQKDGYSGNAYQQVAIELQERLTLTEAAYASLFERHAALQRENAHLIDTMKWIPVEQELPPISLDDCPVGLFRKGSSLGFKSEYQTQQSNGDFSIDAYVVESGEYFWGGAKNAEQQRAMLVTPLPAPPKAEGGGE